MFLAEKLQEMFNISYSDATVRIHENFYGKDVRRSAIERLPYSFVQALEQYGVILLGPVPTDGTWEHKDHRGFFVIKHPFDVQFGRSVYGNLKVPHDFALKVVSLGHLPI